MLLIFLLLLVIIISLVVFLKRGKEDNYYIFNWDGTDIYLINEVFTEQLETEMKGSYILHNLDHIITTITDVEKMFSLEQLRKIYLYTNNKEQINITAELINRLIPDVKDSSKSVAVISPRIHIPLFEYMFDILVSKKTDFGDIITDKSLQTIFYDKELQILIIGEIDELSDSNYMLNFLTDISQKSFILIDNSVNSINYLNHNNTKNIIIPTNNIHLTNATLEYGFNNLIKNIYEVRGVFTDNYQKDFVINFILSFLSSHNNRAELIRNIGVQDIQKCISTIEINIGNFLDGDEFKITNFYLKLSKNIKQLITDDINQISAGYSKCINSDELLVLITAIVKYIHNINILYYIWEASEQKKAITLYINNNSAKFIRKCLGNNFSQVYHKLNSIEGRMTNINFFSEKIDMYERSKTLDQLILLV